MRPKAAPEPAVVLTLPQVIEKALSRGNDVKILESNPAFSKAQHNLNVAKNSFALSGNLGYGQGFLSGDQTLSGARSSLFSGSQTGVETGLTFSNPMTSISLAAVPYTSPAITLPAPVTASTSASSNVSAAGISINQILWNTYPGGPGQAVVDKSLLALQSKELQTESARLSLILQIKQAYYLVLSAQRNIVVRQDVLDRQNLVLDLMTAINKINQASSVDLKTAQINAMSAKIDLDSALHDLRLSRIPRFRLPISMRLYQRD